MDIDLPEDIVFDAILSRLPCKSLLRLRSVSKLWQSRISSSNFAKLHLKRASEIWSHKLIVATMSGLRFVDCSTSNRIDYESAGRLLQLPFASKGSGIKFRIFGSANGLVCLGSDNCDNIYIWNPCSNEYNSIPALIYPHDRDMVLGRCGFGYDVSADDYKLLIVLLSKSSHDDATIHLFSSRKGTWICFQDPSMSCVLLHPRGVFLNGTLHWASQEYTSEKRVVPIILSFGLANHTFEKVHVSYLRDKYGMDYRGIHFSISILDGFLCFSAILYKHRFSFPNRFSVWLMKKYGLTSSWTELTITQAAILNIHHRNQLVRFDPETSSFKPFKPSRILDPIVYMETMISPRL